MWRDGHGRVCFGEVKEMLGLDVVMEVLEVEIDPVARAVAARVGGERTVQLQPHDVWEWAVEEDRTKGWLGKYGELDLMVCGWTCQGSGLRTRLGSTGKICRFFSAIDFLA